MKSNEINESIKIEYWSPTLNFRWFIQGMDKNVRTSDSFIKTRKLQQMFQGNLGSIECQGNLGSIEWRDVPTEIES